MNRNSAMRVDIGKSFFFDRSDDDVMALCTSGIEHEERETAVTGDEAEFFFRGGHAS